MFRAEQACIKYPGPAAQDECRRRQKEAMEAFRRDEDLRLPATLDYAAIGSLSNEVREKLTLIQPRTLGQAGRIEGMTPGALTALLAHVKKAPKVEAVA